MSEEFDLGKAVESEAAAEELRDLLDTDIAVAANVLKVLLISRDMLDPRPGHTSAEVGKALAIALVARVNEELGSILFGRGIDEDEVRGAHDFVCHQLEAGDTTFQFPSAVALDLMAAKAQRATGKKKKK
jgi:hypothetical protein